jgi:hypothetical protein
MPDAAFAASVLRRRALLSAGSAGICLVPREGVGRTTLRAAADVNAVPPLGIGASRSPITAPTVMASRYSGALGVGNLKMKIHKACIARLFERNDVVLDAEDDRRRCRQSQYLRTVVPRVIGIDPGTVSLGLCGLQDGAVFLDRSLPTADALANPPSSSAYWKRRTGSPWISPPDQPDTGGR